MSGSNIKFKEAIKIIADKTNILFTIDLIAIYVILTKISIDAISPHKMSILT